MKFPPPKLIPLDFQRLSPGQQSTQARQFYQTMLRRRTVRDFSSAPVPFELLETAIRTAATAPSGANRQPWKFVVVSDPAIKTKIRAAAEEEERAFYEHRAPDDWLEALAPLGTDWRKEFLETAPYLIVVFREDYTLKTGATETGSTGTGVTGTASTGTSATGSDATGNEIKSKNYYVMESVGIACGFLLAALHLAGLATLTHTPSPMGFLCEILARPKNEKPYLLIPVGYPAEHAQVPDIQKKTLSEVLQGEAGHS